MTKLFFPSCFSSFTLPLYVLEASYIMFQSFLRLVGNPQAFDFTPIVGSLTMMSSDCRVGCNRVAWQNMYAVICSLSQDQFDRATFPFMQSSRELDLLSGRCHCGFFIVAEEIQEIQVVGFFCHGRKRHPIFSLTSSVVNLGSLDF